jgi:hypothetical protein
MDPDFVDDERFFEEELGGGGTGRRREVNDALGNYRSFQGDELLPSTPFGNDAGMGRMNRPREESSLPNKERPFRAGPGTPPPSATNSNNNSGSVPPPPPARNDYEYQRGLYSAAPSPAASAGPSASRMSDDLPPPRDQPSRPHATSAPKTPLIDRKLSHFLDETVANGPKDYFDKEMENLLLEKYQPVYPWLKPGNLQFLRSVLTTFLEHKGAQVEMDLRDASEQAAYEWDELMNILSLELERLTGSKPTIESEGNNQWGIYGSGRMSAGQRERRRQLNKKAFAVSESLGGL